MARFTIDSVITLNATNIEEKWEWTTWELYWDREYTNLIISNEEDEVNLREWDTPIPISDTEFYDGSQKIYGRVRIKYDGKVSAWAKALPCGIDGIVNCSGFPYKFPVDFSCGKIVNEWEM